ncbi:hypothetical protein RO3G_15851 [Rhizopus delemar RA 99-880]|jgi:3-polyprenyl-4-hydroxybenzoate decarboxylase|uniref:Uncharacterized protein n=1 Tax=Rhizopus delemar (strain RA 99-880 / ATCC MYA-4621 / FGSC 9543 / NRRL 43880) TaxID=246409 RepID=I1CRR0_RHIO9|nr:hypothetical protein RO3G_15851 [Rhizopus delemar RA 99-880]|eukprot:EIE91140.1 hypothetical protein RO3G_15851 [Rhizopus delemar RA 99-880]
MSTKRAKPSNQFYCKPQDIEDLLSTQRIIDLPGVIRRNTDEFSCF